MLMNNKTSGGGGGGGGGGRGGGGRFNERGMQDFGEGGGRFQGHTHTWFVEGLEQGEDR